VIEKICGENQKASKGGSGCSARSGTARQKELSGSSPAKGGIATSFESTDQSTMEILVEGQECPFCRFAKLKKEYDEITCPICGYGHKPST